VITYTFFKICYQYLKYRYFIEIIKTTDWVEFLANQGLGLKIMTGEGENFINNSDAAADATLDSSLTSPASKSAFEAAIAIAVTVVIVAIATIFWLLRPPIDSYTQSVLNLSGDPLQGRSIFVMNCVACHGQWADGKVGPNLHGVADRKSDIRLIKQVVSGETPPMPQFQPSPQDMADLLTYLKQL
jgi:mono/diheme cytochrome c family protein